jgi:hypothetical protein
MLKASAIGPRWMFCVLDFMVLVKEFRLIKVGVFAGRRKPDALAVVAALVASALLPRLDGPAVGFESLFMFLCEA